MVDTARLPEEPIYDFRRKTVFSPHSGTSRQLKFCLVRGAAGAASKPHTHPGDEIVLTLAGESTNILPGAEVCLQLGQALAVLPGTVHQTAVTGHDGWQGISFYCDECPVLAKRLAEPPEGRIAGSAPFGHFLASAAKPGGLPKTSLFSPAAGNARFVELYAVTALPSEEGRAIAFAEETILYVLSGTLTVVAQGAHLVCDTGKAVLLPTSVCCRLQAAGKQPARIIVGSCGCCPLLVGCPA